MTTKILIGTSGFSYQDWKGPFYPEKLPAREMLPFYSTVFSAVEINSTYYAIPLPQNMEAMIQKTEGKMDFVVKANQEMTHHREKMEKSVPPFLEALRPLQDHKVLGCVLLQFPFSFHHNPNNQDYLTQLKDRLANIPLVVEFRNRDWIKDQTFDFLRKNGIGYCCVDEPDLPGLPPPIVEATSSIAYVRFHGRNKTKWWKHEKAEERYDYEYSEEELKEWVTKIKKLSQQVEKLYAFFNNHPGGKAPRNAQMMMKLLKNG